MLGNYKIKVNNEAESKEAQELFKQIGFTWYGDYPENGDWYSHLYAEKSSCCHLPIIVWNGLGDKFQEITLPQLKDLVVLHRNDVNDANYKLFISPSQGYLSFYKTSDDVFYAYAEKSKCWDKSRSVDIKNKDLEPIQSSKEDEQGLISGADALRAIADGKDVEYFTDKWVGCDSKRLVVSWYLDDVYQFRIKPTTVKIEIEIPKPFEPKVGDYVYFLCSDETKGYAETTLEDTPMNWGFVQFGAWRTEKEVKQVVAALRSALTSKQCCN